uniref:Importin N-terminal domain-containing protein n=1 Tax=Anopheles christyi TaxID=43041 RepID=A0A182KBG3_9DIPT
MQQPLSPPYEVEALLERFYHNQTNNEEKQRIDLKLQELQLTSFNWRYCLAHMDTFNNPYLWFFAANTVERTVVTMWKCLNQQDRQQLRHSLLQLFSGYPADVPAVQRDKVAFIMAQVGRQGCSDNANSYGQFVEAVLQLLRNKFMLGLALCGAIGDSVLQNKVGPADFLQIVQRYTPQIMHELNRLCALFALMAGGNSSGIELDAVTPERKNQYCCQLMAVVQQYFSWMRLDQLEAMVINNITILACSGEVLRDGAIGSVGALTELLYRNECLAPEAGSQLAAGVFGILVHATHKQSDELYQDKVCELVRQYMKRGWPQGEQMLAHGDEMWLHLFRFMLSAKTPQALMDRVNVWTYIVGGSRYADDGDAIWQQQGAPRLQLSPQFAQQLTSFLNTSLFFHTYPDLEHFDDEELDENSETELQRFQNQNLDLIVQLMQWLEPKQVEDFIMSMLLSTGVPSPFTEGKQLFRAMIEAVRGNEQSLERYTEHQIRVCMVDYITASKLSIELCGALYAKFPQVDSIIHQATAGHIHLLLELTGLLPVIMQLSLRMSTVSQQIYSALAQFILETKNHIQLGPLAKVHVAGQGTVDRRISPVVSHEMMHALMTRLPHYLHDYRIPTDNKQWMGVVRAAIDLISFYMSHALHGPQTCTLVYEQLGQCGVNSNLVHLDRSTRNQVFRMVCNCLLQLEQEATFLVANNNNSINGGPGNPSVLLEQYVSSIGNGLLGFRPDQWLQAPVDAQKRTVRMLVDEMSDLTDLLAYFETPSSSMMRTRLANAMFRLVEQVLTIFRSTICVSTWSANDASACELINVLLDFCCQAVSALQSKLNMHLLKQVIDLLHELFTAEERFGVHRLRSARMLLRTFRKLVPDPRNKTLMPDIIQVVLQELLPIVANDERFTERDESLRYEDVLSELYDLLHDLLHHRWQYFVVTNPMMTSEPGLRSIVQPESFIAIMNAYGYVLTSNTGYPQVVRIVLSSLIMLDERRNLYRLPLFVDRLADNFIRSLLRLALSDTGHMHLDLISKTLYGMSRVDPFRLKVVMCDMDLSRQANTFKMLQTADDPSSFLAVIEQMVKDDKARSAEVP